MASQQKMPGGFSYWLTKTKTKSKSKSKLRRGRQRQKGGRKTRRRTKKNFFFGLI